MSFFESVFGKKDKVPLPPSANNEEARAFFDKAMQEMADEEKKKMDAMSRLELIHYNAETRVIACYSMMLLKEVGTALTAMGVLDSELVKKVNALIKKQPVKPFE